MYCTAFSTRKKRYFSSALLVNFELSPCLIIGRPPVRARVGPPFSCHKSSSYLTPSDLWHSGLTETRLKNHLLPILFSVSRCVILISGHHQHTRTAKFCWRVQLWSIQGGGCGEQLQTCQSKWWCPSEGFHF
jgi:hypothetical protein